MQADSPARSLRRADLLLIPILLAAAALRIATAGYSLWFDEIASIAFARQPLTLLWSAWMAREVNPPLYYTLLGGWMEWFGESDSAVRMLSVMIGLVAIVAAWWLARRIGGIWAGLIAAALLAVSAAHVDFSQEARGYILAQAAALLGCMAMMAYLERPRAAPLVGYVAAATVALYAHTTMVVFVALANLGMFWLLRHDPRALARWLAANIAVALLWSWWAWIVVGQARVASHSDLAWIARPSPDEALALTSTVYLPFYTASSKIAATPLLTLTLLGGLIGFALRDRRPAIKLLALLVVGAPVLLWALSQIVPIFLERTLFWALAPLIVMISVAVAGLSSLRIRWGVTALLLASEGATLARWIPTRESEAWPQALAEAARIDPRGAVLVEGEAMGMAAHHYLPRGANLLLVILEEPGNDSDNWARALVSVPHVDPAGARALLARRGTLFTLTRGDHDPGRALASAGIAKSLSGTDDMRAPRLSLWRVRAD